MTFKELKKLKFKEKDTIISDDSVRWFRVHQESWVCKKCCLTDEENLKYVKELVKLQEQIDTVLSFIRK